MSLRNRTQSECDYGGCVQRSIYFYRVELNSAGDDVVYFKACWDHHGHFSQIIRNMSSLAVWETLDEDEYLVHSVLNL